MARKQSAFTLIEIVIVVAIMALLAGIAVPVIGATLRIGETQSTVERVQMLAEAIENYFEDTGRLPASLDELVNNSDASGWCGPYVNTWFSDSQDDIFHDAWRNSIEYTVVNSHSALLRSWGYNGRNESGEGDDIDLNVDVSPLLRRANMQLLDEINHAIRTYNQHYRVSPMSPSCFVESDSAGDNGSGDDDDDDDDGGGPPGPPPWAGGPGGNPNAPGQSGSGNSADSNGNSGGNSGGQTSSTCNHTVPSALTGHWHTHWYVFDKQTYSTTHRHDLDVFHCLPVLHPGLEHLVEPGMNVIDVPLLGPWAYTLELLEIRGLLDNSGDRYTLDAWGNPFVTGPDPVQYVTSQGSE